MPEAGAAGAEIPHAIVDRVGEVVNRVTKGIHEPLLVCSATLDEIDKVVRHILRDERRDAFEAAHVVATMIDTLRGYFDGKINLADTAAEMSVLARSITEAADPLPEMPPPVDERFDDGK